MFGSNNKINYQFVKFCHAKFGSNRLHFILMKNIEQQQFGKNFWTYLCTIAVSGVMLFITFLRLHLYPFGNNTLIYMDGDQYFSFAGYLQNTFFSNNNLLYSWSNVLGGNMISTYAYYSSSPFNIILLFFENQFLLGYHVIFCIKIVTGAVFFAILLNELWPDASKKSIVLFSASYPFMGYVMAFAWNQSWMDGVIFLPLLLVGILTIVRKQKFILYTITLTFALFANFYIGYMMCIASVILFVSVLFFECKNFGKMGIKILCLYTKSSILSGMLAGVLLIPAYFGLPLGRNQNILQLVNDMDYRCMAGDILSMLYGNSIAGLDYANNYPFIFVGMLQFVLIVSFFINNKISQKAKVISGIVILIFFISFMNTVLDVIWHGMSSNVAFNYRYSFILSFILELIAFYSFMYIQNTTKHLFKIGAYIWILTVFMMGQGRTNVSALALFIDTVLVVIILFFIFGYVNPLNQNNKIKYICFVGVFTVALWNITENGINSVKKIGNQVQITKVSEYKEALRVEKSVQEMISEEGFYRRASTEKFGRCDAMLFGFHGVQNYASTENTYTLKAAKGLGIEHVWMWCEYNDNVPMSTDMLLGIKYITSKKLNKQSMYSLAGKISKKGGDLYVLRNENALPLVFPVESEFYSDNWGGNTFDFLNGCWNSISQMGGEVFRQIQYEKRDAENGRDIVIRFTADNDNPIYMFIPTGDISIERVNEEEFLEYSKYQDIVYIGTFSTGEEVEIVIHVTGTYDGENNIIVCAEDYDAVLAKTQGILQKKIHIEKKTSSNLSVLYNAEKDEILSSTIPFDYNGSWHVLIDGKEVLLKRNMNSFLAFECPKGNHEIEFYYEPKGFKIGCVVSGISFFLFLLCIIYNKKKIESLIYKWR